MYSNLFVCLFGIGTVFFGLTGLIILTMIMGAICVRFEKKEAASDAVSVSIPAGPDQAKQQELEVAAAAAIAEELRVKIGQIQIISMKKI